MDDSRISRRRLLAAAGGLLSASAAGCLDSAPTIETTPATSDRQTQDAGSGGSFPETFDRPEQAGEPLPTDSEFTEVYRESVDSVGAVRVEQFGGTSGGTAWVYDDDYMVTNDHVVRDATAVYVWFTDVGWREASIVGRDVHSDLAVISVTKPPAEATPLPIIDQPQPVGTEVAAIGNPFGLTGSFTTGVISGRNRTISIPGRSFSIADGVQTDAALNPGNSGGPLVTLDGSVVGVISAGQGDNVGFAISAAMVKNVVPELIETGSYEHSYIGVDLRNVTPEIIEANDLPVSWGVYINEALNGTPADGVLRGSNDPQGVRQGAAQPVGGDVIVRMDDWSIPNRERLSAFLALETEPGDTIEIEVVRDGTRQTFQLTLGSRPTSTNP
jgi:S1-C subfamily serine protease